MIKLKNILKEIKIKPTIKFIIGKKYDFKDLYSGKDGIPEHWYSDLYYIGIDKNGDHDFSHGNSGFIDFSLSKENFEIYQNHNAIRKSKQ